MRRHEQALLLARRASEDAALLAEVILSARVSDEIFGFHAQQSAEKFLKALLSEYGVPFPRTHNLRLLMDLLADAGTPLPPALADLDVLTPYGTLFRYDETPADLKLDRTSTLAMVKTLSDYVAKKVSIP